jgi:hypothetical protein
VVGARYALRNPITHRQLADAAEGSVNWALRQEMISLKFARALSPSLFQFLNSELRDKGRTLDGFRGVAL